MCKEQRRFSKLWRIRTIETYLYGVLSCCLRSRFPRSSNRSLPRRSLS
uniref:Uncharacterized protein n=1 Tax=Anguilla anguilla TaxID=7936 RepID=A0A0E9XBW6_ANGAN